MSVNSEVIADGELSLHDIIDFVSNAKGLLVGSAVTGLFAGLVAGAVIPNKYQGSVLVEPSKVADAWVEPVDGLVEKMSQPAFYSEQSIRACALQDQADARHRLTQSLSAKSSKNSSYLSIQYKNKEKGVVTACLDAVLADIRAQQKVLAEPTIKGIEMSLNTLREELRSAELGREHERQQLQDQLAVAKSKLEVARRFVDKFAERDLSFNFQDPQFSASALLLATLLNKQNEVKDLEAKVAVLEMQIADGLTQKDQLIREIKQKIDQHETSLAYPRTKLASYTAPIYVPDQPVEPKPALLVALGLFVGMFIGVGVALARTAYRRYQAAKP